ncbi:hypothetical protein ACFS07_18250 [Undibacterium arcticum]
MLGSPNGIKTRVQVGFDPYLDQVLHGLEQQQQRKLGGFRTGAEADHLFQ